MNFSPAFDKSIIRVFGHEDGYQCDPIDRGNWTTGIVGQGELRGTKYGICAMSYPYLDIKNITLDRAKEIYWNDFWSRLNANHFNAAIGYQLFDSCVNHGIGNTVKMIQRAVGEIDDGIMGPVTRKAIYSTEINDLLMKFIAERIVFMTYCATFPSHGKGWMRRMAQNLVLASEDN